MKKVIICKTAQIILTAVLAILSISGTACAAEKNISLANVNPEWMNQQLVLQVNELSYALNIGLLNDPSAMDTFLNGVNTQLAAYTMDDVTKEGVKRVLCYQLNDEFKGWLVENLQIRLQGTDIGTVTVNLADNHLKLIELPVTNMNFSGYVLAGASETGYETSSKNRCNNIEVAASHFNHYVVQPGQVISASDTMLPRTTANGYLEAGAYINGETVPAIGGGICQVSSTVYNAVMNAGLTVLERHAHSMPVSYLPLGQDAAISQGALDMKFRNDYDAPIIILTETKNKRLTVAIYVKETSLQGRGYRFWSQKTGALSATSYLTTYLNGVEIQTVKVANSKYKPHS